MIEVSIVDDFAGDSLAIGIRNKGEGTGTVYATMGEGGRLTWQSLTYDQMMQVRDPTFRIPQEIARALLDALVRHYQGASDLHTVRQDFLHERARVDRCLGALIQLATGPEVPALRIDPRPPRLDLA